MSPMKTEYQSPKLTIYGDLESLTQATVDSGTGDLPFMMFHDGDDHHACVPGYPEYCAS